MICPGTRASSTVPGTRARAAAPLAACTEAPAMIIMISGRGRIARALANHMMVPPVLPMGRRPAGATQDRTVVIMVVPGLPQRPRRRRRSGGA